MVSAKIARRAGRGRSPARPRPAWRPRDRARRRWRRSGALALDMRASLGSKQHSSSTLSAQTRATVLLAASTSDHSQRSSFHHRPTLATRREGDAGRTAGGAARPSASRQRLLPPGARLPSVREAARAARREPEHGGGRLRPAAGATAWSRRAANAASSCARRRRASRAPQPEPHARAPRAGGRHGADPRHVPARAASLPGPGLRHAARDWLDLPLLHGALRRAMTDGDERAALRRPGRRPAAARRACTPLAEHWASPATPAQIVTTAGATQALDIVSRALLEPGDAVLVDEPGWAVEYARLSRLGMRLLPVPRGPTGRTCVMRAARAAHRPRAVRDGVGAAQPDRRLAAAGRRAPGAASWPRPRLTDRRGRHLCLAGTAARAAPGRARRAAAHRLHLGLLEDPDAELARRLPGRAAARWSSAAIDLKLLTALTTPTLPERALAWCWSRARCAAMPSGWPRGSPPRARRVVRLAQDAGCRFARRRRACSAGSTPASTPSAWPSAMPDEGWLLAPGRAVPLPRRASTLMRINFATAQDARSGAP